MKLLITALAAAILIVSSPTSAQEESDNPESENEIEEIIVTATFRDTKLMDTPISISVVDGQTIQDKGIIDFSDLYTSLPSVSFSTDSNTYNQVSIRGLTSPNLAGGATVGIYVDDIPITDSFNGTSMTNSMAIDLARVEALKGPQGTLYGEGAVGGAIRYITNDADPNKWEFKVNAGLENNRESDDLTTRTSVVINIPAIQDTLGIRLAGFHHDTAGFLDILAPRNENDVDHNRDAGGRIKMNLVASDWMSVEASYNYNKVRHGGPGIASFAFGSDELTDPAYPNGGHDQNELANVTLEMEFADKVAVTASLSQFEREVNYSEQISPRFGGPVQMIANCAAAQVGLLQPPLFPSPFPGLGPFLFCVIGPGFGIPHAYPIDAVLTSIGGGSVFRRLEDRNVAEIRAISIDPDARLQWVTGLYAKRGHGIEGANSPSPIEFAIRSGFEATLPLIYAFISPTGAMERRTDIDEIAAYADVVYRLTEDFDLNLGLRVSSVSKETSESGREVEDDKIAPKLGFAWRPQDGTLVYGTAQRGYRPGFFNQGLLTHNNNLTGIINAGAPFLGLNNAFSAPRADENGDGVVDNVDADIHLDATAGFVQQEGDEVDSYELGVKTRLMDDRITFIGTLFYNDWQNTYILIRDAPMLAASFGDLLYMVSGGEAHTQGIEFDIVANLSDRLTLSLGGDYTSEAQLDKVPVDAGGDFSDAFGNPVPLRVGNRLPDAPEFTVNLGIAYDMPLPRGMTGTFALDYYRVDDLFVTATNETTTPAYNKLDARFTAYTDDRKWRFSLYGKNLTDETILFGNSESGLRFGRPRSFGLEVSYNIGH